MPNKLRLSKSTMSTTIVTLLFLLLVSITTTFAEDLKYQRPPEEIASLIEAPRSPGVSVSPDKKWMLLLGIPGYKSIEEVAQPEVRVAGIRISPKTFGPSRSGYYNNLVFKRISDGQEFPVENIPENSRIDRVRWSPDGKKVSFCITSANGIHLWITDFKKYSARQVYEGRLNASIGDPYTWMADSRNILIKTVIENIEVPIEEIAPEGPIVQVSSGRKAAARTYQDLLKNPYDDKLFEYYLTTQLMLLNIDGSTTPIGQPGMHSWADPSPDGKYILVNSLHRPFSYTVPYYRFPKTIEVWNLAGELIKEIANLPLAEEVPIAYGSVTLGPRSVEWRADAPAMLCWTEALDGGDAAAEAEHRDQLYLLEAPFDTDPTPWLTLDMRYSEVTWGSDDLAFVNEWWWATRQTRSWSAKPGTPTALPKLIIDRSWQDRYADPGTPLMERNKFGRMSILTVNKGKMIFLRGAGASDEGDRPFLDEYNLSNGETTRLFHSEEPYYERAIKFLDVKKRLLMTSREAIEEPPNYYLRDLKKNTIKPMTAFPHPTPALLGVSKEMIKYKREDGLDLTGTLYLPKGYTPKDGPLPTIFWAYPEEFKSADAAGQVKGSPFRFVRVSYASPLLWLAKGYAIIDHPSMPIIGEGDTEPNDTFREQLVSGAQAAIDELVKRGVTDPERVAVGGHSYGAFMTANLLAHSDIFRAGIARSGAYNRTLTPFGFQSEERTFWEAPEVYSSMSPFMHADKIDEPILLIHGEADNNSGTFPLQSKRFYSALKGLGATARLVMLPHESHGYRALESVLHQAWEIDQWLEKYVKTAPPRETLKTESETGNIDK